MTRITDIDTVEFKSYSTVHSSRWGYQYDFFGPKYETTSSITRIATDEGIEGLCLGGNGATTERRVKPLPLGEDPLDREKL